MLRLLALTGTAFSPSPSAKTTTSRLRMDQRSIAMHPFPRAKTITDVIHRSIDMHPLCVKIIDTPEFQRLRGIGQLGVCRYVFPGAVHDRFQHSIGVSHLAGQWAEHFRAQQPCLQITDEDILCVQLAGLLHDLGHGPFSHFWESQFLPAAGAVLVPEHEALSCALIDRLIALNQIDTSPWLQSEDISFVKALIRGAPPPAPDDRDSSTHAAVLRVSSPGVVGKDKAFLYEIVANSRSGFDVDKLDCTHAGSNARPAMRSLAIAQSCLGSLAIAHPCDGTKDVTSHVQLCVAQILSAIATFPA
jgi:hypothetical protein